MLCITVIDFCFLREPCIALAKSHLILVYNPISMLLDLACWYRVKGFFFFFFFFLAVSGLSCGIRNLVP